MGIGLGTPSPPTVAHVAGLPQNAESLDDFAGKGYDVNYTTGFLNKGTLIAGKNSKGQRIFVPFAGGTTPSLSGQGLKSYTWRIPNVKSWFS